MPPAQSEKLDFTLVPPCPSTKNYYGSKIDGTKDDPTTYQACDLDLFGIDMGTWEDRVPKHAQLSDYMVGKALMCGIQAADLVEWYPCDFVFRPGKILSLKPDRVSSGHPSVDRSGKVHLAYGMYLTGDPIHAVDIAMVGFSALTHATLMHTVRPFNEGIEKYYTLKSAHQTANSVSGTSGDDTGTSTSERPDVGGIMGTPTKKRKLNEPKGPITFDATTSTKFEILNYHFQQFLVAECEHKCGGGPLVYDFAKVFRDIQGIWDPKDIGYKSLLVLLERSAGLQQSQTGGA